MDLVECSGSEYNLTECDVQNTGSTTSHSLDVGVKCQPGLISHNTWGFLRLLYNTLIKSTKVQNPRHSFAEHTAQ